MHWDNATRTIVLQKKNRHTSTTKYIRTREELSRWQWFLDEVWNARFRWVEGIGIVSDRESVQEPETLAEKRP